MSFEKFFQQLNYSAVHEDTRSELEALRLTSGDRVACITGGGSRPLELLLGNPKEVLAIDMNPAQCALIELQIAAIRELSRDQFLAFAGIIPSESRLGVFERLGPALTPEVRRYWDQNSGVILRGFIYSGHWEGKLRRFARFFAMVRRSIRDRLFAAKTVVEQEVIWREQWDNHVWTVMLRMIFNPTLWYWLGNEPGAFLVPRTMDVPGYIKTRFKQAVPTFLFRDSAWAWLVFYGRYDPSAALPLYLQSGSYEVIASRLNRVRIVRDSMTSFLNKNPEASINAFSTSDVCSYMTELEHKNCWQALLRAAATGARICERRFLVRYQTDWTGEAGFVRDLGLEMRLSSSDQSIVYDFVCGAVTK